jgi:hypothetical protein
MTAEVVSIFKVEDAASTVTLDVELVVALLRLVINLASPLETSSEHHLLQTNLCLVRALQTILENK